MAGQPLRRIQVKGFKSIRDLDLTLRPLNVLIGPNGAGKSNLIAVFELLYEIVNKRLQVHVAQAGGADSLLHYGQRTTEQIELALTFGDSGYACTLVPTVDDQLVFAQERCWFHDQASHPRPYDYHLGSGHKETRLSDPPTASLVVSYAQEAMQSWRVYHFHDTSASAKIKKMGDINDNRVLRDDASNLSAFLYMLGEAYPQHYERIVAAVRLMAPFFDDFGLRPNPLNPETIRLEWREKGSDAYFNAHAFSDGTLRFICLATLLQMPYPPATILIDEPELGLHPYAIALLAALLRSAAQRTQVIVATQSVTLLNQMALEDVVVADREGSQSVFRRPDAQALAAWLEEYGMGDLWEKNLLGGRPA